MAFAGLANPKDRADIIAYLKGGWTFNNNQSYLLKIFKQMLLPRPKDKAENLAKSEESISSLF